MDLLLIPAVGGVLLLLYAIGKLQSRKAPTEHYVGPQGRTRLP